MNQEIIKEALRDQKAVDFLRRALLKSYSSIFVSYEDEAVRIVNTTLNLLQKIAKKGNKRNFHSLISEIHKKIFQTTGKNSWFPILYRNYKLQIRSKVDFEYCKEHIKGNVLDFGSNGGYFSIELQKNNIDVHSTDVLDCRDQIAAHIPFIKMEKPDSVPFESKKFGSTIVKTVFHHINNEDLLPVLSKLRKISKRIIIKEDIYGVTEEDFLEGNILENDSLLREYIRLGNVSQLHALVIVDFFGNVLAHGIENMDLPFNFKTISEWKSLLHAAGFKVKQIKWYGFDTKTKLHQNLQAWIICE
ncbi:MAG: hypothetical protein NTV98_03765 [Candidatus Roizmanbacteria bacterium]|nr:hypothetical protein [Candidatus Roizmanbacteria bacterium]